MSSLLQQAFTAASQLPEQEQNLLASRLLAAEDEFDRKIAASADKLAALADQALAEFRSGQTEELTPERR